MKASVRFFIILPLLGLLGFLDSISASAAIITVNTTNLSNGSIDDGLCTLKEAMNNANGNSSTFATPGECVAGTAGVDTIQFNLPGCDDQNTTVCTIRPSSSVPTPIITESLIVEGPGTSPVIIDPSGDNARTFVINSPGTPGTAQTLTLRNLTLQRATQTGSNGGSVTVNDPSDKLVVENCLFDQNQALLGGALEFRGTELTIKDSTFLNNAATSGGGGAIQMFSTTASTVKISNSLFKDNQSNQVSSGSGGAILWDNSGTGSLSITNTTFSGNRATGHGGAIFVSSGTLNLSNVTMALNVADDDNDDFGDGGALFVLVPSVVNVKNSILSNNGDDTGEAPNCIGTTIVSMDYNILDDDTGCEGRFIGANDQVGVDPFLFFPVQDNGGLSLSFVFMPGSTTPALDAGNPAGCTDENSVVLTADQRGFPRPVGTACDVGAVEVGTCGDGGLDPAEECDDGNNIDADGCQADCVHPICGDGILDSNEGCDDGNGVDNDDCKNNCVLTSCGDGTQDLNEACDDGNNIDGDGCQANCINPICGDGITDPDEECDDGNTASGDGCQADCSIPAACGDDVQDAGESCDDGNTTNGDGCDANCQDELAVPDPPEVSSGCSLNPPRRTGAFQRLKILLLNQNHDSKVCCGT